MRSTGHAKIIPDKNRHRCLRELFLSQLRETPLKFTFPSDRELREGAEDNWITLQARVPAELRELWDTSTEFQQRIQVNFLRHRASNYDELRGIFRAKPVKAKAHSELHRMLKLEALDKIARRYPKLAEQCRKQRDVPEPVVTRKRSRK